MEFKQYPAGEIAANICTTQPKGLRFCIREYKFSEDLDRRSNSAIGKPSARKAVPDQEWPAMPCLSARRHSQLVPYRWHGSVIYNPFSCLYRGRRAVLGEGCSGVLRLD